MSSTNSSAAGTALMCASIMLLVVLYMWLFQVPRAGGASLWPDLVHCVFTYLVASLWHREVNR